MADPIKNFIVKRKVCLFAELNKSHTKKGDLLHFVVLYNMYRYNNIYFFFFNKENNYRVPTTRASFE